MSFSRKLFGALIKLWTLRSNDRVDDIFVMSTSQRGATLTEYAILVACLGVLCAIGFSQMAGKIICGFSNAAAPIASVQGAQSTAGDPCVASTSNLSTPRPPIINPSPPGPVH